MVGSTNNNGFLSEDLVSFIDDKGYALSGMDTTQLEKNGLKEVGVLDAGACSVGIEFYDSNDNMRKVLKPRIFFDGKSIDSVEMMNELVALDRLKGCPNFPTLYGVYTDFSESLMNGKRDLNKPMLDELARGMRNASYGDIKIVCPTLVTKLEGLPFEDLQLKSALGEYNFSPKLMLNIEQQMKYLHEHNLSFPSDYESNVLVKGDDVYCFDLGSSNDLTSLCKKERQKVFDEDKRYVEAIEESMFGGCGDEYLEDPFSDDMYF